MENKTLSRLIALYIRMGTEEGGLEYLHKGITPSSKTGDFSDVKVVTPYGEIAWNDLSRISDKEMRELMLGIENKIESALISIEKHNSEKGKEKTESFLKKELWEGGGATWDLPKNLWDTHPNNPSILENLKNKK